MEPTESYRKQKRSLMIFTGLLYTALLIGIEPSDTNLTFLPFKLSRPSAITHILAFLVLYNFAEHVLNWRIQIETVRSNRHILKNFKITNLLAASSLGAYVGIEIVEPNSSKIDEIIVALHLNQVIGVESFKGLLAGAFGALIGKFVSSLAANEAERKAKEKNSAESEILNALSRNGWVLNFNTSHPYGRKKVEFRPDGTIGEGNNANESTWRLRNNYLEILETSGVVHSRFKYLKSENVFLHTNDEDTRSIKGQKIYFDPSFAERI